MRMTIEQANAQGLLERIRNPVKRTRLKVLPRQAITSTPVANGIIHEAAGAWLKINDMGVVVRLPYPVSANALWRSHGDTNLLSKAARQYKRRVHGMYLPLLTAIGWKHITAPMEARLMIQPPERSKNYSIDTYPRYDVDNYSKPILDCLKSGDAGDVLYRDDRLFVRESVRFARPADDGYVWVSCIYLRDNWLQQSVDFEWLEGRNVA